MRSQKERTVAKLNSAADLANTLRAIADALDSDPKKYQRLLDIVWRGSRPGPDARVRALPREITLSDLEDLL
jgi:hypothetical protein